MLAVTPSDERGNPGPVNFIAIFVLVLTGALFFVFNFPSYLGGDCDDGRYLEIALRWADSGPELGRTHWALRWPLIVETASAIKLFGVSRLHLAVMPLLTWLVAVCVLCWRTWRHFGAIAAFTAAFAFIATPELVADGGRINADLLELLFCSASLWCFFEVIGGSSKTKCRATLLASGALAAFAFATRETSVSLLILYGLLCVRGRPVSRAAFLWIGAGFASVFLLECTALYVASGDPLWRLHVDMNHVNVPSDMMEGAVAGVSNPLGHFDIAARWLFVGPIKIWWPVNPFLNLFARAEYGFLFSALAVLLFLARYWGVAKSREWRIIWFLLTAAGLQIGINVFVLVTDPQPRMFLPAIYAACVTVGITAQWIYRSGRFIPLLALYPVLLVGGLWGLDQVDNSTGIELAAERLLHSAETPIYVDRLSRSMLALIPAEEGKALVTGLPPINGFALTVQRPQWPFDTINDHLPALPRGECWREKSAIQSGRIRGMFMFDALLKPHINPMKIQPPFKVAIYQHIEGISCADSGHFDLDDGSWRIDGPQDFSNAWAQEYLKRRAPKS